MEPREIADPPLLRAVLRALLFAAVLETLFYRLLTLPARAPGSPWLEDLHVSTGRAGQMMFFVAFLFLLPALVSIAYGALRHPRWPGLTNGVVAIGILTLTVLAVSASVNPHGPIFALGFGSLSLMVQLGMLAGMFERRTDPAGRALAVLLAGALLCMWLSNGVDLAERVSLPWLSPGLHTPAASAGMWLLFGAGAMSFFAFSPPAPTAPGRAASAATYGLPAASAFALIVGAVVHPPLLSRLGTVFGVPGSGTLAVILTTSAAATALFLVLLTAIRGLRDPGFRTRAAGLVFLVLAGYPHRIAYEHLLAVLGVALITGAPAPLIPRRLGRVDNAAAPDAPGGAGDSTARMAPGNGPRGPA